MEEYFVTSELSPFIIQGYNDKVKMNLGLTCPTASSASIISSIVSSNLSD
jgi:hypothetical protein